MQKPNDADSAQPDICSAESCRTAAELFNGNVPEGLSGIGRRTFLVQSGLMAAMAMLAACGASSDLTAPPITNTGNGSNGGTSGGSSNVITIANYPSLASVGGVAMITIGNAPIAIVRTGASTFVALSRVCPHQGGIVQQYGNDFVCPNHGATFNLSGTWIGGQPTSSLHAYSTAYDATAGTLTVS